MPPSALSSSNGNHNNNKRQIASLGNNTPKRIRISDNAIDKQSLERIEIDGYRQSLKENGFAEIDIPEELQEKIDVVNKVLRGKQHNHKNDDIINEAAFIEYLPKLGGHLAPLHQKFITELSFELNNLTKKTLNKIFNHDGMLAIEKLQEIKLKIRNNNYSENIFHKDPVGTQITVIYPMLEQRGTAYILHKDKKKYQNLGREDAYGLGGYIYSKEDINTKDIKHAKPNKIFLFLNRRASKDLGEDYDDKSLIHAVPKSEKPDEPRIFMLGRFGVEDKKPTPPE